MLESPLSATWRPAGAREGGAGGRGPRHRRGGPGRAGRAGGLRRRRARGAPGAEPARARRRHVHRQGQAGGAPRPHQRPRRRRRDPRPRAHARPAALAGGAAGRQGDRPHGADPGHLRAARPQPRGQGAGGAGAAELPAAPAARLGRGHVAPGRRHRHARPRRDEDGGGPPAHPPAHLQAAQGHQDHGADARHEARAPPGQRPAAGRHRGLHERGQVHADERRDRGGRAGGRPALRHPRSHRAPAEAARGSGAAP